MRRVKRNGGHSSIYSDGCPAGTQVRLRACATFQSVLGVKCSVLSGGSFLNGVVQSKLLRRALAGVQPPEIDGQVARDGDDGFLARGSGGFGPFRQQRQPRLHRWVIRLEPHQSPREFDQRSSQSRVAVLGHAALHPLGSAAVFAGAKAGVTGDLSPVLEPFPVADFAAQDDTGQPAQAARQIGVGVESG